MTWINSRTLSISWEFLGEPIRIHAASILVVLPWRYNSTWLRIQNYINSSRPWLKKLANGIQLYNNPCWVYLGTIPGDTDRDMLWHQLIGALLGFLHILKRTYKNACCIHVDRFPWRYSSAWLRIASYIYSCRPSLQKMANAIQFYNNPCGVYLGTISSDTDRDMLWHHLIQGPFRFFWNSWANLSTCMLHPFWSFSLGDTVRHDYA